MIYKTYINRLICPADMTIDENTIWMVLRTNPYYMDETLISFSNDNSKYYIHFLDGDNWGTRDIWINGHNMDCTTALEFFNLVECKDLIFGFADEFLILDTKDRTEDIKAVLSGKNFTMTGIVLECSKPVSSWGSIRLQVLEKLYAMKNIEKGKIYHSLLE